MSHCVDQCFTKCANRIFVQRDVVDPDNARRMERVLINKCEYLLDGVVERPIVVLLPARFRRNLGVCIGIGKNLALGIIVRRSFSE
jgi:hypothetical protein